MQTVQPPQLQAAGLPVPGYRRECHAGWPASLAAPLALQQSLHNHKQSLYHAQLLNVPGHAGACSATRWWCTAHNRCVLRQQASNDVLYNARGIPVYLAAAKHR